MESTYISTGYNRFPKVSYGVNNNMSVVHIILFIINNVQQPASYICISVEHHWFSLLIGKYNSDPESLKHDMSLMKVYIHTKCLTTLNFLATPLKHTYQMSLYVCRVAQPLFKFYREQYRETEGDSHA